MAICCSGMYSIIQGYSEQEFESPVCTVHTVPVQTADPAGLEPPHPGHGEQVERGGHQEEVPQLRDLRATPSCLINTHVQFLFTNIYKYRVHYS